jgi:hypothetical protein
MRKEQRFEEEVIKPFIPSTYTKNKTHPIAPNRKRVTIWVKDLKAPKNSLAGLSCSVGTLGEQYDKFKADSPKMANLPVIDEDFYFLLGTQDLSFYCESKEGKKYKVETNCKPIPCEEWLSTT